MFRTVYTAFRKSGTHEAFVRRWRLHGGRAMAQAAVWSSVTRYIQGDSVCDRSLFPGAAEDIDGVGDLWWDDEAGLRDSNRAEGVEAVLADGRETFDHSRNRYILAEDHLVRAGEDPPTVVIWVFHLRPPAPAADRTPDWQGSMTERLIQLSIPSIRIGRALDQSSDFDIYLDLGFQRIQHAQQAFAAIKLLVASDGELNRGDREPVIVPVRQRLLYERADC